ncbi:hypothetical protein PINS_up005326 [Pythium insidiosum]|nr:hypothetical protein PINS_up005326 [Pythium insidiosum]
MLLLDKTSERLRSKHVRTLELLQKTLDENVELRDRLGRLQKGALHLGQGVERSNSTNELEDEIDRLKAEHCSRLLAAEEAARVRHEELTRTIETLHQQQQRLQNDVLTLEARLRSVRENALAEREQWLLEREQLIDEKRVLEAEIKRHTDGRPDTQAELCALQSQIEAQRLRERDLAGRHEQLQREARDTHTELTQQTALLEAIQRRTGDLERDLKDARDREARVADDLDRFRERNAELQAHVSRLQQIIADSTNKSPSPQPQADDAVTAEAMARLNEVEEQNSRLVHENLALRDSLTKLQTQLNDLNRSNAATGSIFAVHVDLKRENAHLRAQVEELKQLQRRFLTTAKKKTMRFPAIS